MYLNLSGGCCVGLDSNLALKRTASSCRLPYPLELKRYIVHFKEILASVTGVSTPIFGIQWKPLTAEVTIAKDILRDLEDKRVLYRPHDMEDSIDCHSSVEKIRAILTSALKQVEVQGNMGKQLSKMRRACREFCDIVGSPRFNSSAPPIQQSLLSRELSRLRNTIGGAVAAIAISYGLDVEDDLASIIPFNNVL